MYCPKCLNESLRLKGHGVIQVVINKKQMDAGRVLYNVEDQPKSLLIKDLSAKIEEFFKWYSDFKNKETIETVELMTNDIVCEEGCSLELNQMYSVIDVLLPAKDLYTILIEMGKKYNIEVNLTHE